MFYRQGFFLLFSFELRPIWKDMKKLGNEVFEKAVELEKAVRQNDSDLYFHKLALQLQAAVKRSEMQLELFDGCNSWYCLT